MSAPKQNQTPESGWPRSNGMTVPEGYFATFAEQMMAKLPVDEPQPKVIEIPRKSLWQTLRPYVYMAAMFAGIWLMMNMFSFVTPAAGPLQGGAESGASLLADVVSSGADTYVSEYFSTVSDYDLYDDLYDAGFDIPEF